MIGSIIGDIVGSIYEFDNIKTKDFPLFSQNSTWTDDTILTIATAHWILDGGGKADIGRYYSRYGLTYRHPMGGYGDRFERWLKKSRKGIFDGDTVPQAIVAFLDGENFEDCIRNAISIGGEQPIACRQHKRIRG